MQLGPSRKPKDRQQAEQLQGRKSMIIVIKIYCFRCARNTNIKTCNVLLDWSWALFVQIRRSSSRQHSVFGESVRCAGVSPSARARASMLGSLDLVRCNTTEENSCTIVMVLPSKSWKALASTLAIPCDRRPMLPRKAFKRDKESILLDQSPPLHNDSRVPLGSSHCRLMKVFVYLGST